jgi:hypothetical protein
MRVEALCENDGMCLVVWASRHFACPQGFMDAMEFSWSKHKMWSSSKGGGALEDDMNAIKRKLDLWGVGFLSSVSVSLLFHWCL